MKYKDTTEEQRKDITPYLKYLFEMNRPDEEIKAYQQAQQAEIEFLKDEVNVFTHSSLNTALDRQISRIKARIAKLKFESELE